MVKCNFFDLPSTNTKLQRKNQERIIYKIARTLLQADKIVGFFHQQRKREQTDNGYWNRKQKLWFWWWGFHQHNKDIRKIHGAEGEIDDKEQGLENLSGKTFNPLLLFNCYLKQLTWYFNINILWIHFCINFWWK